MVSQAWRNCLANGMRSPPAFKVPRSRIGTSCVRAARTICCILLSIISRALLLLHASMLASRTYDTFTRHVHPKHDPALRQADQGMQSHPDHRKDDQDCEGAGHIEIEVLLQDEIAEARLGPDEFADNGADHRQNDRDIEPDE